MRVENVVARARPCAIVTGEEQTTNITHWGVAVPKRSRASVETRPLFTKLVQCELKDGVIFTAGEADNGTEILRRYGAITIPYATQLCFALLPLVIQIGGPPMISKLHALTRRDDASIAVQVGGDVDLSVYATKSVAIAVRDALNGLYPPAVNVVPMRKRG